MLLPSLIGQQFSATVSRAFTERRDRRIQLFNANGRTWQEQLVDADCELLEYVLCKLGLHTDAKRPQFDTFDETFMKFRTEVKSISKGGSVTLKQYTLDQDFDMYLFFEFLTDHSRPYEIGTNVKMRIVERGPKKDIERRSQRSKYPNGGRYVWPDYNKNNYVQTLESVV